MLQKRVEKKNCFIYMNVFNSFVWYYRNNNVIYWLQWWQWRPVGATLRSTSLADLVPTLHRVYNSLGPKSPRGTALAPCTAPARMTCPPRCPWPGHCLAPAGEPSSTRTPNHPWCPKLAPCLDPAERGMRSLTGADPKCSRGRTIEELYPNFCIVKLRIQ